MNARKIIVAGIACSALFAGGCVSSGTYTTKEQEALQLSKDLQTTKGSYSELEDKYNKALSENSDLKKQITDMEEQGKKVVDELNALKVKHDKLVAENRPENLVKKIGERFTELQQAIDKLQAENEALKKKIDPSSFPVKKKASKAVDRENPEKKDTETVKPEPTKTEPAKAEPKSAQ